MGMASLSSSVSQITSTMLLLRGLIEVRVMML